MDAKEFQLGYQQLFLPLGMYALRIVGDVDLAQDVVQSAFEQAWTRVETIDALKPYMYRVVHNGALAALKREELSQQVPIEYCGEVTDEVVDTSERDARLWRAIDELPQRCRQVFLMSKRDGLSNAEIADELDISIKTVEAQITKAFSKLRKDSGINGMMSIWFLSFF